MTTPAPLSVQVATFALGLKEADGQADLLGVGKGPFFVRDGQRFVFRGLYVAVLNTEDVLFDVHLDWCDSRKSVFAKSPLKGQSPSGRRTFFVSQVEAEVPENPPPGEYSVRLMVGGICVTSLPFGPVVLEPEAGR